jgi:site-specific recombinase XerD
MTREEKDLHNMKERIETFKDENNYKVVKKLDTYLSLNLDNPDTTHHYRNLHNAVKIKKHDESRDLLDLDEDEVKEILTEIERSAYYNGDSYKKSTKNKFRKTLDYILKLQDLYWDDVTPRGMNIYQKIDDQEKTDKDELLNPVQLNKFLDALDEVCKDSTTLNYEAFFYTLWNTGARVGGARNIKIEDVKVEKEVVSVSVPSWKDSPFIAFPEDSIDPEEESSTQSGKTYRIFSKNLLRKWGVVGGS